MTHRTVVVVDVGVGNLGSVERALRAAVGEDFTIVRSRDPASLGEATVVVFPGQGAFGDCSLALGRDNGAMGRALKEYIAADRPFLGICLGLQVLFEASEEAPGAKGLGVFKGQVRALTIGCVGRDGETLKIPHMGWNRVTPMNDGHRSMIENQWFYFVHGYHVVPTDPSIVAAMTDHGDHFVSAVSHRKLLAVQFHPEKSQRTGLGLLRNFIEKWS